MTRGFRRALIGSSLLLGACGGEEGRPVNSTTGIFTATNGETTAGEGEGEGEGDGDDSSTGPLLDMPQGDGDGDTGEECAAVSEMAQNQFAPVDIIFVIDTSGSMSDEKNFVQSNMNLFSQQIFLANIDHHVVMIAESSPDGPCVGVPLGSGSCPADTKLPEYLHVVETVGSSDALAKIISTEQLWSASIRPNSIKHIVVVSDDDSSMDAATFDAGFKALNPDYANYFFHAIVAFDDPNPFDCGLGASCCAGLLPLSADVGDVYLQLVSQTAGVAGDLCDQEFGPVFDQIAQSVQQNVPLACEWEIPEPPEGDSFDSSKVNVELVLDGQQESVYYVESEAACNGGDGWFYLPDAVNPETIRICPATCTRTQAAVEASVDILFGCDTVPVE
ncbi:hypothetical protein ENSA5_09990 [Enhygromyxa salina]|uniref:VWFA domain-containing protein n=1 Tax=Enhygromyxa salina TaxID=215803 RepID=A0A2S9YGH7_9BACT|nr:VWA domain-containing protein [Enhygromyxa salina]PRQ04215.1 hypothetical protein ENSA5_09990 [Enhygromyxa salina]